MSTKDETKTLSTDEKIEALVDDLADWSPDRLLEWAQAIRLEALEGLDPSDVDREYAAAFGDRPDESGLEDDVALDRIVELLDGQEWDSDTMSEVARLVRATDRTIRDPNEMPEEEDDDLAEASGHGQCPGDGGEGMNAREAFRIAARIVRSQDRYGEGQDLMIDPEGVALTLDQLGGIHTPDALDDEALARILKKAQKAVREWRSTHCEACSLKFTQKDLEGGRCSCGSMICAMPAKED